MVNYRQSNQRRWLCADALVAGGFQTFCISETPASPCRALTTIPERGGHCYSWQPHYFQRHGVVVRSIRWGHLAAYHYAGAAITDPGQTYSERANDANSLQLAFWTLEGQYWYGPGGPGAGSLTEDLGNPWLVQVADAFGGGTNAC